ncbi:MAG: hypothetical protein LBS35_03935 [Synergistaceae bacterium]|nr:hypothetical protein [Synergistaceae bacterium]
MPFDSSYRDFDRQRYIDSRDFFAGLAKVIVKEPLSTHIVRIAAPSGKTRYLVVDRSKIPAEGDIAVIRTDNGLRIGRVRRLASLKNIWGKVIWILQEA